MTNEQAQILGGIFRYTREARGWSLEAVETRSGIPHSWLFELERGHYRQPAPKRLADLAELLEVDPALIDAVTRDHLANSLPSVWTYFRSKKKASPAEIVEIEAALQTIHAKFHQGDDEHVEGDHIPGATQRAA
jgi:transcriptional regulator with XRE-family HTH domain